MSSERFDYIIVGAGQAGLAMAYQLKKANANFLVLDAENEIGASWLNRWDSLKLFTPTEFNHLPGLPFPAPKGHYPNKVDVANYLKQYVSHFELPVVLDRRVERVSKVKTSNDVEPVFELQCNQESYIAQNVIVASGPFHTPFTPPCHKDLAADIIQIHSKDYRNPEQLQDGDVLVVGAGDSGFQILDEISSEHKIGHVYFSGNTDMMTIPQEILGKTLWWWFKIFGILSINKYTWLGKKISQKMQPVIGIDIKGLLARNNVTAVGRTIGANDNTIQCEEKTLSSVRNIVWSTGFRPDFSWLDCVELDKEGYPVNFRGVSSTEGLFFIGLPWMYTRGSATLGGVIKDAEYLGKKLT